MFVGFAFRCFPRKTFNLIPKIHYSISSLDCAEHRLSIIFGNFPSAGLKERGEGGGVGGLECPTPEYPRVGMFEVHKSCLVLALYPVSPPRPPKKSKFQAFPRPAAISNLVAKQTA